MEPTQIVHYNTNSCLRVQLHSQMLKLKLIIRQSPFQQRQFGRTIAFQQFSESIQKMASSNVEVFQLFKSKENFTIESYASQITVNIVKKDLNPAVEQNIVLSEEGEVIDLLDVFETTNRLKAKVQSLEMTIKGLILPPEPISLGKNDEEFEEKVDRKIRLLERRLDEIDVQKQQTQKKLQELQFITQKMKDSFQQEQKLFEERLANAEKKHGQLERKVKEFQYQTKAASTKDQFDLQMRNFQKLVKEEQKVWLKEWQEVKPQRIQPFCYEVHKGRYEGKIQYGIPNGLGKFISNDSKVVVEGKWKGGVPEGKVVKKMNEDEYFFELKDGKPHGKFISILKNQGRVEMQCENGSYHGRRRQYYKDMKLIREEIYERGQLIRKLL